LIGDVAIAMENTDLFRMSGPASWCFLCFRIDLNIWRAQLNEKKGLFQKDAVFF
jgi:hypothetical protein